MQAKSYGTSTESPEATGRRWAIARPREIRGGTELSGLKIEPESRLSSAVFVRHPSAVSARRECGVYGGSRITRTGLTREGRSTRFIGRKFSAALAYASRF